MHFPAGQEHTPEPRDFLRAPSGRPADPRAPLRGRIFRRRSQGLVRSAPDHAAGLARVDRAPGPRITARSPPTYIFQRRRRLGGAAWLRRGARRAAGAPGGPAPSPSSTSSPACPSGAPRPGLPEHRSRLAAKALRSPGSPGCPSPRPVLAVAAAAPAGPRSPPRGWVSELSAGVGVGNLGRREVGAERDPRPAPHCTLIPQAPGCRGH